LKRNKGAETRRAILEATIDCYNHHGYANTTQGKIAKQAGLSMGALTYHFPSIVEVTRAAIEHAFEVRLEKHRESIERTVSRPGDFENALEIYWKEMIDPLFMACHELAVAARTDPALQAVLKPAHEHFQEQWNRNLLKLHPEWKGTADIFRFAVEYSTCLAEGMALSWQLRGNSERRMQELLDFMKDNLEMLLIAGRSGMRVKDLLRDGRARRAAGQTAKAEADIKPRARKRA
jgi:AcrR family transcriptional regulator